MTKKAKPRQPFVILSLVLAWLIPGAGHVYIGRPVRGAIIFITIAATFWAGMAIGGVMTVDKRNERWWYIAEMCTGVHGLVGWMRSSQVYEEVDRTVDKNPEFKAAKRSVARGRGGQAAAQQLAAYRQQYSAEVLKAEGLALVTPAETVARAYAGVAGLLNLLCIFDAVVLSLLGNCADRPRSSSRSEATDRRKGQ